FDRFAEELAVLGVLPWVGVGVKLGALVGPDAAAEADVDSPLGQVVEDRQILGQADGVPPHRDVGHLADSDPARPGGQVGANEDGVRQVAEVVRTEMVLAHPDRLEAELLGERDLLAQVVQRLRGGGGLAAAVVERREDAEAHGCPPDPTLATGSDPGKALHGLQSRRTETRMRRTYSSPASVASTSGHA